MNKLTFVKTAAAAMIGGGLMLVNLGAGAADTPEPQRPGRAQMLERIKEKLELTDEQSQRIKSVLAEDQETLKNLVMKMHEARMGLRDALQAADASEKSVRAAADKVGAVQADLAVERFKMFKKINPILTQEQREKVKQFQGQIDDFLDTAIKRAGERLNSTN